MDEENVDDIDSDDIPLGKKYDGSVAKRLRSNKGKVVASDTRTPKRAVFDVPKVPSEVETPKTRTKTAGVGLKKSWSKVRVKTIAGRSRKRKVTSSNESEYDVEMDVQNIIPSTSMKSAGKKGQKTLANVPIDKVSFHLPTYAQRWKFIFHRRLDLERVLGKEAVNMADVMDMIKEAGLLKTLCYLENCYEKLVKEFLVNISEECDNSLSQEY